MKEHPPVPYQRTSFFLEGDFAGRSCKARWRGVRSASDSMVTEMRFYWSPGGPPIWARFYEIETNRPFFCDRDGVKKYDVSEIGSERRNGYSWYTSAGERMARAYADWPHR